MDIIIPMAGRGQRFVEAGYPLPKFLLEAHGKSMLEWSLSSLPLDLARKVIFVGLEEHEKQFSVSRVIDDLGIQADTHFVWLPEITRGQSETVIHAEKFLDPEKQMAIFNIDTAFFSNSLRECLVKKGNDVSVLGSFCSIEDRFSFARCNEAGKVVEVREKKVISDCALTGFYHFSRADLFVKSAQSAINRNDFNGGEFYVAPLYNDLIDSGNDVVLDYVDQHHILGTPEEYESFKRKPISQILTS